MSRDPPVPIEGHKIHNFLKYVTLFYPPSYSRLRDFTLNFTRGGGLQNLVLSVILDSLFWNNSILKYLNRIVTTEDIDTGRWEETSNPDLIDIGGSTILNFFIYYFTLVLKSSRLSFLTRNRVLTELKLILVVTKDLIEL